MQKNHYESAVIINAAIEEEQIEATINRISELIRVNGGEILEVEKWGRKRLAYTLDKTKSGYYVIFRFTAPTDLIAKLERMYQLDEFVLRFLTIVLDKFALEYIEKSKAAKAQEAETAQAEQAPAEEPAPAKTEEKTDKEVQ
ncbi:MAG: 30S ribosomal protein S6 [Bacteroidota bacterium]|jgi:small subunit ribosomal protein S6|nr:30S ribosomal protein S6 [Ignavibacteria bacterium]HEX2963891.1 30S ribosomal protein S6 [Ignavibacteriales bacterium]MCU7498934.1 30S ribosomal protein S6 [Ignavibacteria bacterium]MCU7513328.1 30S ribosomal protein S6 [Ignavibacteria bacterium]MCU7521380.1 30S ribosomal protein S6 [Ignavibacteria bacterium]